MIWLDGDDTSKPLTFSTITSEVLNKPQSIVVGESGDLKKQVYTNTKLATFCLKKSDAMHILPSSMTLPTGRIFFGNFYHRTRKNGEKVESEMSTPSLLNQIKYLLHTIVFYGTIKRESLMMMMNMLPNSRIMTQSGIQHNTKNWILVTMPHSNNDAP